eukprot:TRINITY_DN5746_c0_g3_i1.p1 TRINITY_DN5746_c0_g3~~TRINITY_DN5746_c0_g3_i1.p1  ORF type:complete len:259 (+),score=25.26 TRINITY_DN5746_c0_g3_i1:66-842(+)
MIHGLLDQIQPGASDDEDEEGTDLEFVLLGTTERNPSSCKTLVICGPGAATAFALGAVSLQPQLPWQLKPAEDSESIFPPAPKSPKFFLVSEAEDVVVALLDSLVPADYSLAFGQGLFKAFSGLSQVILLDRLLRSEWSPCDASGYRPQEPYLTGLWTSSWSESDLAGSTVSQLPAPNYVQGLAAALLSCCEVPRMPRCLVVLTLQDGAHLGHGCVQSFEGALPLLKSLKVLPGSWKSPDYREAVRKVVPPSSMSIYA